MATGDDQSAPLLPNPSIEGNEGYKPKSRLVTTMSPEAYLDRATSEMSRDWRKMIDPERVESLKERMRKGLPIDAATLDIDMNTGRTVSQEGRHRAIAAQELGIRGMPVIVWARDGGVFAKPTDEFRAQFEPTPESGLPTPESGPQEYRTTFHEPTDVGEPHTAFKPGRLSGYEDAPLVEYSPKSGKHKGEPLVGIAVGSAEEARAATGMRALRNQSGDGYFVPIDYVARPDGETIERTAEGPVSRKSNETNNLEPQTEAPSSLKSEPGAEAPKVATPERIDIAGMLKQDKVRKDARELLDQAGPLSGQYHRPKSDDRADDTIIVPFDPRGRVKDKKAFEELVQKGYVNQDHSLTEKGLSLYRERERQIAGVDLAERTPTEGVGDKADWTEVRIGKERYGIMDEHVLVKGHAPRTHHEPMTVEEFAAKKGNADAAKSIPKAIEGWKDPERIAEEIKPVGYSPGMKLRDGRYEGVPRIAFDNGVTVNEAYYDTIKSKYPNATFHSRYDSATIVALDKGKFVGALMPIRDAFPDALRDRITKEAQPESSLGAAQGSIREELRDYNQHPGYPVYLRDNRGRIVSGEYLAVRFDDEKIPDYIFQSARDVGRLAQSGELRDREGHPIELMPWAKNRAPDTQRSQGASVGQDEAPASLAEALRDMPIDVAMKNAGIALGDRIRDVDTTDPLQPERRGVIAADEDGAVGVQYDGGEFDSFANAHDIEQRLRKNGLQKIEGDLSPTVDEAQLGIDFGSDAHVKRPDAGMLYSSVIPGAHIVAKDVTEIYQKDLAPLLRSATDAIVELKDQLISGLAPRGRKEARAFGEMFRERLAQLALDTDRLRAAFQDSADAMDKLPPEEKLAFIDRMERGQAQPTEEAEALAQALRDIRDTWVKQVQDLGTGKLQQLIENYFPHIWKDPAKADEALKAFYGKRPFEGDKSFLKKRTIDYVSDGLAMGLELATDNPVELMMIKVHQMQKYVMAHQTMEAAHAMGLRKFNRSATPSPGHEFIDDKGIGYVYARPEQIVAESVKKAERWGNEVGEDVADALVEAAGQQGIGPIPRGRWEMPTDAARLINNYLSPGLRYQSKAFRGYLVLANHMNMFQLGWSAFHMGFVTMDGMISRFGLGTYQIAHGDLKEGAKSIAIGLTPFAAPIEQFIKGNRIMKEWMKPGSQGELYGNMVHQVVVAGGRAKMDSFYQTQSTNSIKRVWRDSVGPITKIVRTSYRLPGFFTEQAMRPVLEGLVPRMKLGAFAQMAHYEVERLGPEASPEAVRSALQKAWDSVDNRLGQLVYDNLFWNKAVKDLAMASTRSVGWNLGTFRELGGGLGDFGKAVGNAARLKRPEFTHRMSYVIALPVMAGIYGGITQWLMTGQWPQELKDYYFPKTGGTDEGGSASRVSLPTYMKDVYAYYTDYKTGNYLRTIGNKTHPMLASLGEMFQNRDYYGTEIAHPDDPVVQQIADYVQFGLKTFMPFAARGIQRNLDMGEGLSLKTALPFVGITPAPRDINETEDERILAEDVRAHLPQGARTKEATERAQEKYKLRRAYAESPVKGQQMARELVKAGTLSQNDVNLARKQSRQSKVTERFKRAKLNVAIEAYTAASEERRAEYRPILYSKVQRALSSGNLTSTERKALLDRRKELFQLPFHRQSVGALAGE